VLKFSDNFADIVRTVQFLVSSGTRLPMTRRQRQASRSTRLYRATAGKCCFRNFDLIIWCLVL